MNAQSRLVRCAARSALRGTHTFGPLAIAAIGSLLSLLSGSARADTDPTIIWLAAGAHGAPCNQTSRCAANLRCDPASVTCLNPARIELSLIASDLCVWDDATAIHFRARNVGEVASDENVQVNASVDATYVDGACSPDGPGTFQGSWWKIYDDDAQTHSWPHDEVRVQLDPGESKELTAVLERWLPPYTYRVTVDTTLTTPSGGYVVDHIWREIPAIEELNETCTVPGSICN